VRLLSFHITISGYEALSAADGLEAIETCRAKKPDLVILDIMLPHIDGWDVCRKLKKDPLTRDIPIIMLSALSKIDYKLKGFDLGTDDYVAKPFSPRELIVRIKRVLARSEGRYHKPRIARIGRLEIDLEDFIVRRNGREVFLTRKEKGILKLFIDNPGRVLSHSEILDAVWEEDKVVEYGNIDVHISHLREKLDDNQHDSRLIVTVKGEGYKLDI